MLYPFLRPLFFFLPPEVAHYVALEGLKFVNKCHLLPSINTKTDPISVMGITFPNRVGLAAGLDKNADYIEPLSQLGFGFIEVGTVTPRPQAGNPKPRLFRLPQSEALINRMGFNNKGLDYMVSRLRAIHDKPYIIGANFGKNRDTPLERAHEDYVACLKALYPWVSYLVVNISSPNTPGLRDLQAEAFLDKLLRALRQEAEIQKQSVGKHVPLLVKIAPDLDVEAIKKIAQQLYQYQIDGVIATNTTLSRPSDLLGNAKNESGGLSGKPLRELSLEVIRQLRQELGPKFPIIGVGGIASLQAAKDKIAAGADLIQLYSGLIYEGPSLVQDLIKTPFQSVPISNPP